MARALREIRTPDLLVRRAIPPARPDNSSQLSASKGSDSVLPELLRFAPLCTPFTDRTRTQTPSSWLEASGYHVARFLAATLAILDSGCGRGASTRSTPLPPSKSFPQYGFKVGLSGTIRSCAARWLSSSRRKSWPTAQGFVSSGDRPDG